MENEVDKIRIPIDNIEFRQIKKMSRNDRRLYLIRRFDDLGVDRSKSNLLKLLDYEKLSMSTIEITFNKHFYIND